MKNDALYLVHSLSVVDLIGQDAGKILHNLTTNDVQSLAAGDALETFITDVRGKVLHHVTTIRTDEGFRMIGPAGTAEAGNNQAEAIRYSQRLVNHCDRYTIREDAMPVICDDTLVGLVAGPNADVGVIVDRLDVPIAWHACAWLGEGTKIAVVPVELAGQLHDVCSDEAAFHLQRTRTGFPWYGIDFNEKNLPQEADRDAQTINFKKGCYLGQETVARLDALGQVQKKLVQWRIHGAAKADDALMVDDKVVGRLTSVASDHESADAMVAIGMARRSHFDAGATAVVKSDQGPKNSSSSTAEVIAAHV